MSGYTRQESYADDDVIEATHSNNEFDQLVAAFSNSTGHAHDGTAGEGPVIALIGDAGQATPYNKVLVDTANNNIGFWVDISSVAVEQVVIEDGAFYPVTDNDVDLGKAALQFKDGYFDGTVYMDSMDFAGTSITQFITDDNLTGHTDNNFASTSAIKAYVDANIGGGGAGDLLAANNLSDVDSASTSRTNLGLQIGVDVQQYDTIVDSLADLTDPNADRIVFWDESVNALKWLTVGTGLSISATTLSATGASVSSATTTSEGVVELATTAEVTAGSDTTRAVTCEALNDGYQGTANVVTLGTIATGTWEGTDVGIAHGGTGASLADPNADRIMFWDDSAGAVTWLTAGTGLSIADTTITASGLQNVVEDSTPALGGDLDGQDYTVSKVNLKDYGLTTNAIGSVGGGTQDIDLTLGNSVTATVDTSTTTFTFSNPTASDENCEFVLYLTNGGSQTVNWPAAVDWPNATAPTLTSSGVDILVFRTVDGGTTWYGAVFGLAFG